MKTKTIKTTKTINTEKIAKEVINILPSFNEMMNDDKYLMNKVLHPIQRWAFSKSLCWEGVAMGVHKMCYDMFGLGLYSSYNINNENNTGYAYVYDANGGEHKLDAITFMALTKVLLVSFLQIPLTEEQGAAICKFHNSSSTIARILN